MPNPQNETLDNNMDVGRAQRFSENEVKVLVHEVKARQARIYGTASRPTRREDAKQAWVEVAMAVSSFSGIHRTVDQVKKKFDSTKRSGRRKAEANRKEQLAMGGSGQAMVQVLTPAEDLAASTLFPESIYYDIVEVQVGGAQGEQCVESRLQVKMNSPDDSARDVSMKQDMPLDISIKQEEPEDHPTHLTHGHLLHPGRGGLHVPDGFGGHLLQEQTLRPTPGEKQGFFTHTDGPLDQQTPIDHTWATGGPGATCGPHYHLMRPADLPAEEEETDWDGTGAERGQQHPSAGGTSAAALAAEREGSQRPKRPRPLEEEEDPGEGTSARHRRRLGNNNALRPEEEDRPLPPTGFRLLERELGGLRRGLHGVNLAMRRGLAAMARHERLLGRGVAALERSAAALESLASLQRPLAPPLTPTTAAPTSPDPEP